MEGGTPLEKKYGRLMIVDFDNFLKTNGEIEMRVDSQFDSNEDYIEKISVISKSKMACVLMSGKIVVRNIMNTGCSSITYMDSLTIPCPEQLQVVVIKQFHIEIKLGLNSFKASHRPARKVERALLDSIYIKMNVWSIISVAV